ncbi:hypothetical protein QN277_016654 [Acacia crassicarpa]|uniref:Uncharacterized protein n=1 Tax=Acacia crassicarpa TaxID=499986 RepID=A0AAE1MX30_9FABA|nr:hypothetical protein QN277_016654 [Acacia crassicarpa]
MWSGGGSSRSLNFGHSEMGMVGLRDVFVVAPASSYHHHHNDVVMADPHHNAATIHGVIPLLTAAPCLDGDTSNMLNLSSHNNNRSRNTGIQLWQDHYLKKQGLNPEHGNGTTTSGNLAHSGGGGGLSGGSALSSGGTTCQDCGNQAKKDCSHRRCRTCCKSRGFDCPTHVKSTWVSAARRRERQLMAAAASSGGGAGFSGATSVSKKPRLVASQTTTTSRTSTSNTTPPRSFETSSSHQDASFKESLPGQVRAPAVFKCVRVTAVADGDDEYAYQAVVKIGGHVFKGFLYDQGVENGDGYPNLSELHLGGGGNGGTSGGGAGRNGATSSSLMLDPSDLYAAASGGGILAGSTYGNAIN